MRHLVEITEPGDREPRRFVLSKLEAANALRKRVTANGGTASEPRPITVAEALKIMGYAGARLS